jgi:hypothetical protein
MQTHEPIKHDRFQETAFREQLIQEIELLPDELVSEVLNFLLFTKARSIKHPEISTLTSGSPEQSDVASDLPYRPASGESLADYEGGWAGDDFEACLQLVHDTRGRANFSKHEPF